jgi:hypothetical protein
MKTFPSRIRWWKLEMEPRFTRLIKFDDENAFVSDLLLFFGE